MSPKAGQLPLDHPPRSSPSSLKDTGLREWMLLRSQAKTAADFEHLRAQCLQHSEKHRVKALEVEQMVPGGEEHRELAELWRELAEECSYLAKQRVAVSEI